MSIQQFVTAAVDSLLQEASKETYDGPTTAFHARHLPTISISAYLARIFRYAPCSAECFLTSLVYIRRVLDVKGVGFLQNSTVHRLLISAVLLSSKYLDDIYYNNRFYSKIGGISPQEMNSLELEMLFALNFDLSVSDQEYEDLGKQQKLFESSLLLSDDSSTTTSSPSPLGNNPRPLLTHPGCTQPQERCNHPQRPTMSVFG